MELYIKNMVCSRCVMVVENILHEEGIKDARVEMGRIAVNHIPEKEKMQAIEQRLNKVGFEIISDAKSRLIEEIKKVTRDFVYTHQEDIKVNFSEHLSNSLNHDYNSLSSLFSSVTGTTIEKYLINLKIERVKEMLAYDEKTLSEIAFEMGYSSVAHLSGQFKKVTGFTPSEFKQLAGQKRKPIDEV